MVPEPYATQLCDLLVGTCRRGPHAPLGSPRTLLQREIQRIDGLKIQVIRRLVQHQIIRLLPHQPAENQPRRLATRKILRELRGILAAKRPLPKQPAQFWLQEAFRRLAQAAHPRSPGRIHRLSRTLLASLTEASKSDFLKLLRISCTFPSAQPVQTKRLSRKWCQSRTRHNYATYLLELAVALPSCSVRKSAYTPGKSSILP
jgi:hypothetical protein